MFKKIKRFFILIPCMVLGMVLLNSMEVSAKRDPSVVDANTIYVGEENLENKYYFVNDNVITLEISDYSTGWFENFDYHLRYRVVNPKGKTTEFIKVVYTEMDGKFQIDFSKLNYIDEEDISTRNSVAPGSTYYVDLKFYGGPWGMTHIDDDKALKIVYVDNALTDKTVYKPVVGFDFDSYKVSASVVKDGVGVGIVTGVKYFYTNTKTDIDSLDRNAFAKIENVKVADFEASSEVAVQLDRSGDEKYLYILVETGNGYDKVVEIDLKSKTSSDDNSTQTPPTSNEEGDSGLFDFEFGEYILLVLVVVLIVSCALIITQKIVDYKKRLY